MKPVLVFTKKGSIITVNVDKLIFNENGTASLAIPAGDEVVSAVLGE